MKNFSAEEINSLISQLRENLLDLLPTNKQFDNNFYLFRWLMQNNMKIDRTESNIRKSIEWRHSIDIEKLIEKELAFFAPGAENFIIEGFTKHGQRVSTFVGDNLNLRALVKTYGKDTMVRIFYQVFFKLEKCMLDDFENRLVTDAEADRDSHKNGKNEVTMNSKLDYSTWWDTAAPFCIGTYKDFSLINATSIEGVQVFIEGATIGMSMFPAVVSTLYIVNLNKFSNMVLKLIKPIISTEAMKMDFFDTDKVKWTKALFEHIDEDQLPPIFGGTATYKKTLG